MTMERILIIADSPLGDSSYATVGKELAKMLKNKYDVYYGGLQYIGKPLRLDGYTLLSFNNLQNTYDNLVNQQKFDHIIYLRNSWAIGTQGDPFRIIRPFSDDIILYTPVEEQKLPKRFFKGLKGYDETNYYDRIITMTKTGRDIINGYGIESDYLYHNINEVKICRTHYSGIEKNVLNISYSLDYRKNIGSYILMAKHNIDYNFNWLGLSQYYVISDYIDIYNAKNFNVINQHRNYGSFNFLSDEQIADIYGKHTYYVQCSFKEGFDLTVLEALSNGLITFMPNDMLHKELFGDYPNAVFVNGNYEYPAMNQLEYFIPLSEWNKAFQLTVPRKRMGINIKDRFSFDSVKQKLYKIISKSD